MATVTVILSEATTKFDAGSKMPVANAAYDQMEDVTSSGTSAQTTIIAKSNRQAWTITADGGAVRVVAGADPTATTSTGWKVVDGGTLQLGADVGQKLAIIDAA